MDMGISIDDFHSKEYQKLIEERLGRGERLSHKTGS
jgi:hypothetical protein